MYRCTHGRTVESASGADWPRQEDNAPPEHFGFQPHQRIRFSLRLPIPLPAPLRPALQPSVFLSVTRAPSSAAFPPVLLLSLSAAFGFLDLADNYVPGPYSSTSNLSINVSNSSLDSASGTPSPLPPSTLFYSLVVSFLRSPTFLSLLTSPPPSPRVAYPSLPFIPNPFSLLPAALFNLDRSLCLVNRVREPSVFLRSSPPLAPSPPSPSRPAVPRRLGPFAGQYVSLSLIRGRDTSSSVRLRIRSHEAPIQDPPSTGTADPFVSSRSACPRAGHSLPPSLGPVHVATFPRGTCNLRG